MQTAQHPINVLVRLKVCFTLKHDEVTVENVSDVVHLNDFNMNLETHSFISDKMTTATWQKSYKSFRDKLVIASRNHAEYQILEL